MKLIDSHCHLDDSKFDEDREAAIRRAVEAGVGRMLAIGTGSGPPDLEAAIRLADQYPFIYATAGVHPHDASKATAETWTRLEALAAHPKVLAIGEIGLDYHYDFSPRPVQKEAFDIQLAIARNASKPVVIHTREAWDDTLGALRRSWHGGGIMHCFTGSVDQARQSLDLGFYLSFGGFITFPKAQSTRDAARLTPEDRLLVETDCPYLAPVPYRGMRNEPAFLVETVRSLAAVRDVTPGHVAALTTRNFERLCLRVVPPNG